MSAIAFESGLTRGVQLARLSKRLRVPLEAWSRRRRAAVAALIVAPVFAVGAHGWMAADLAGVEASRTALTASVQRVADARRRVARLPALRAELAAAASQSGSAPLRTPPSATWTSADDVRLISALAVQSGVALLTLEPGAASGDGTDRMRPLQLNGRTDFVHLMAFVHGLTELPVLVVPTELTVRDDAGALALSATLQVFSALRPAPPDDSAHTLDEASLDADDDEDIVFFDPFSKPQMRAGGELTDVSQWRLVGVLHDRTRGLALVDTPEGATVVATGQRIGAERVARLDALGLVLAGDGTTRTLALADAS